MTKKTQTLFLLLPLILFSCQTVNKKNFEDVSENKISLFRKSGNNSEINKVQDENDKAVKNLVNSLNRLIATESEPNLTEVAKSILQQEKDFLGLLTACHPYSPYKIEFSKFYRAPNSKYIVQLQCTSGAYQPEYSYCLYDLQHGLELKPLEIDAFYAEGSPVKRTSVAGYTKYNPVTQELTIQYRCDGTYSCGSTAMYKFENNKFILRNFTVMHREKDGQIKYKRIYP